MRGSKRFAIVGAALGMAAVLGAAQHPAVLGQVSPGLWELAGAPGGKGPVRQCVADLTALAQFEHRTRTCTRNVVSDSGTTTVIHYTCGSGEFGDSKLTVITPRSMRIETQGISDQAPFNYVLQARRVGDCSSAAAH